MLTFLKSMDFLTGMAYWGIILLGIINALIVKFMNVVVSEDDEDDDRELH